MARHRSKPGVAGISSPRCQLVADQIDLLRSFAVALERLAEHDPYLRAPVDPCVCTSNGLLWFIRSREGQLIAKVNLQTGQVDAAFGGQARASVQPAKNRASIRKQRPTDTLGALFERPPAAGDY